ncbi:hypothetical protein RUM43_009733 [Polyplax serrata]|uniref:Uncharacterized protein n=1 Tax=Polyplax serrata TaxID=468196 RepID=A0AAN8PJM0_POLSC
MTSTFLSTHSNIRYWIFHEDDVLLKPKKKATEVRKISKKSTQVAGIGLKYFQDDPVDQPSHLIGVNCNKIQSVGILTYEDLFYGDEVTTQNCTFFILGVEAASSFLNPLNFGQTFGTIENQSREDTTEYKESLQQTGKKGRLKGNKVTSNTAVDDDDDDEHEDD